MGNASSSSDAEPSQSQVCHEHMKAAAADRSQEKRQEEAQTDVVILREEVVEKKGKEERKPPYNCEVILKDADSPLDMSSLDKLYDHHLYDGVFLEEKREKYWVDKKSNSNCFMLYARNLSITWVENNRYWRWQIINEPPGDVSVEVVELVNVCWLEVTGKFHTENLSPGTLYEVVFVVKLEDPALGWNVPVNLRLLLPNGESQERKENMTMQARYRWIEIPVGEFTASLENVGEIEFSMHEHEGGLWKKGLLIKGVAIKPKN